MIKQLIYYINPIKEKKIRVIAKLVKGRRQITNNQQIYILRD